MKQLKYNEKYLLIGLVCIIAIIVVINILTSNSYALEGFGEINLTCDKTVAFYGDEINCTITGIVDENNSVTSLSSQISPRPSSSTVQCAIPSSASSFFTAFFAAS